MPDDLSELGEGLLILPDVDDGKPFRGAIADVVEPVWLLENCRATRVYYLLVFLDWLVGKLEQDDYGHGGASSIISWTVSTRHLGPMSFSSPDWTAFLATWLNSTEPAVGVAPCPEFGLI